MKIVPTHRHFINKSVGGGLRWRIEGGGWREATSAAVANSCVPTLAKATGRRDSGNGEQSSSGCRRKGATKLTTSNSFLLLLTPSYSFQPLKAGSRYPSHQVEG